MSSAGDSKQTLEQETVNPESEHQQPAHSIPAQGSTGQEESQNAASTPFEKAIAVWSGIGLSSLQQTLDNQGSEILENHTKSVVTRKELATRTKAFRKLSDEEKIGDIKGLLKLYQAEVDSLTQRSKYAEGCFMTLYKLLAEAPDPTPLLEASVDSVLTASEFTKVASENARLAEKINKYADYDQMKSKLSRLEKDFSESINSKVSAKESELTAIFDEKERHWRERESELQAQVQEARDQIRELRSNSEVLQARLSAKSHNQLVDSITDNNAAKSAGRIAELELVASELERANKRMLEVEKRNVELRSELEMERSGSQVSDKTQLLESRIYDVERENALLAAQLDTSRTSVIQSKIELQKKVESLSREVERKSSDNNSLRSKLDSMNDYQSIKRELEILKSVEFSYDDEEVGSLGNTRSVPGKLDVSGDDDETDDEFESKVVDDVAAMSQSLEKLMLARNKKLVNDLTEMRISKLTLEEKVTELSEKFQRLSSENSTLLKLNRQLEEDLTKSNDTVSKIGYGPGPAMSVISGWGRSGPVGGSTLGKRSGKISPTASIIGGVDTSSFSAFGDTPSVGTDTSILPIITQQRDRFRVRNSELEEDLRKSWNTITQLRKDLESIKRDNVELYEKARYASSYKRGPLERNYTNNSAAESSYRNIYEEGLSPYQQFKGRENERAMSKMGPIERALYLLTRTILVNRTSRYLFSIYCLALHLLVMMILMYGVSWHTSGGSVVSESAQAITAPEALNDIP